MKRLVIVTLFLGLFLHACQRSALDIDVIATVGGQRLTRSEFEDHLNTILGEEAYAAPSEVLSELLDQYLEEELLYLQACSEDPDLCKNQTRSSVITTFMATRCNKLPDPRREEVELFYHSHSREYQIKAKLIFRMILVEKLEEAEKILAELSKGKEFGELAVTYSKAPNASQGGTVGPVELDHLPRNIQDVLRTLKEGQVSSVVEVTYGFLLFQVVRIIPSGDLKLEDVYDDIVHHIKEEACGQLTANLVRDLERKDNIWIYAQHLPFPYSGKYALWH